MLEQACSIFRYVYKIVILEVVTVDDTVDDDEVEPVRNDRHSHSNYNLRNRQFSVFTPFDKIFSKLN